MKIKLKKGLDLKISGAVSDLTIGEVNAPICAICPDDFPGIKPKVDVKEGDRVIAGAPLMHDKNDEAIKLVSPVEGVVKAVVRGERRKVLRIEVETSGNTSRQFETRQTWDMADAMRLLAESGLLAMMRQRPYDIVPKTDTYPRDIFVTAINSAPLAVDAELAVAGKEEEMAAAVAFLKSLCLGKIYLSVRPGSQLNVEGAERVEIEGPHPAGCAGVQACNIAPVNKGDTVWTLDVATLARIGALVTKGTVDFSTIVAVAGPMVAKPAVVKTVIGAPIATLVNNRLVEGDAHKRIVSGDLLSGVEVDAEGYLHYPYRQVSVIAEGDDVVEFMGWASMSAKKDSTSPTFPGHFMHKKAFSPDARINGGRRAMIMSGQYDSVMPMDILPEYLIKAILSHNIESMEQLGIYEVAPEDFAVAEYVDTSKLPLQQIVREGLDYLRQALE